MRHAGKQLLEKDEGKSLHRMQAWPHLLITGSQRCLPQALQSALLLGCSPLVSRQHQLQCCIACRVDVCCQVGCTLLSRCSCNSAAAQRTAWHGCTKRPERRRSGGSGAAPRCGAGGLPQGLGVLIMHRDNRLHVAAARQSAAARCQAKLAKPRTVWARVLGQRHPEQSATRPRV